MIIAIIADVRPRAMRFLIKKHLFPAIAAGEKVQISIHFFLSPVKKQTMTLSFGYFPDRRSGGIPASIVEFPM
jgi:hypothetical protein